MEREGPYILDDNTEEHSCFTCKYFERLLYWNSLACGNKLRYIKKKDNMMYKHPKKVNKCTYWEREEKYMVVMLIPRIKDILKRFNDEVNKKLKKKGSKIKFYAYVNRDDWIIVEKEPDGPRIAKGIYVNSKHFCDEMTTIQTIAELYEDALT